MKDLKIIVRYVGREPIKNDPLVPKIAILGQKDEEHVVRVLMGFVGEKAVRCFDYRENTHLSDLMYPNEPTNQIGAAIAAAINQAAAEFGAITIKTGGKG